MSVHDFETGFFIPDGYTPTMDGYLIGDTYEEGQNEITGSNRVIVPFVACGDLSGYDADQSYPLDTTEEYIEPVQKPINAAYQAYLEKRKEGEV